MFKRCLFTAALVATFCANASELKPMTPQCLAEAAHSYEIHPDILFAIAIVEGGTVGQNSRKNSNNSYDIGFFQINTIHLDTLSALDVSESELRNDGCLNAAVAAWHLKRTLTPEVLATIVDEDSYLRAIARYHSATPDKNEIYARKLKAAFTYLYQHDET